jgi:transposase InsO family protein
LRREHRVWPYLLRDTAIDRPNQVWCTDITYLPMRRGFLYLIAVVEPRGSPEMDWATRKVLSWRVSNTMDVEFCIEALEEALGRFGRPEIFNTDQGSQFTSPRFTGVPQQAGVRIFMDGRGRRMDNVFIERLWRSLKYECVYLHRGRARIRATGHPWWGPVPGNMTRAAPPPVENRPARPAPRARFQVMAFGGGGSSGQIAVAAFREATASPSPRR